MKDLKNYTKEQLEKEINALEQQREYCYGTADLIQLELLYQEAEKRDYEIRTRKLIELIGE